MSGSEESTRYRQDYDHIITINLKAGVSEPRKSTIARANTQRFQDSPGVSRVDLAVTTSAIYRTGRGAQNVRITTRKPDENARAECKATNRWIHTKAQSMSLNVFESRNARVKRWNLGGNAQYAGVQAPEVQQSLEISRSHSQIEGHDAEEQEEGKEGEKVEYTSDVGEAEPTSSPINYAQFVNPVFFHVLPFLSWPTNMEDDITGEDANTPSNSQHDVAELFHGILSTIQDQMTFSNMVVNITDNSAQYHQDRDCGRDLDYVIRNVPQVDYMKLHRLMELPIPLDDCTTCRRDVRYSTISEALQHLKDHHVQSMFGTAQFTRTKISHWIASVSGLGYTCEGLCQQLEKSTKVLRYNIEIAEKGNTRAIRVFTLVTIIL
ncbi:hypothetical protein PtrSN002B_007607 [Pyrenophora tritici-repentis]|nr:hypothetical protein PtrSN002B_007607 [Pyrenophora tritici-repentis]